MEENQERISETELLTEIRNETRKQVKFAKISAAFIGGIFVTFGVLAGVAIGSMKLATSKFVTKNMKI